MKILPNKTPHSNWNNQFAISDCDALHFRQISGEIKESLINRLCREVVGGAGDEISDNEAKRPQFGGI
ncbi:hypothetical protein [Burkholderia sp. MSMB0856]|uniref:hypothetical protein n=1 Tax=Burkholderia sp. MSMB0856 TaxID=1637869 RepID=UPI00131EDDA6|nr:hypothetical protein [Burkholderia sp. MSMB0856]